MFEYTKGLLGRIIISIEAMQFAQSSQPMKITTNPFYNDLLTIQLYGGPWTVPYNMYEL